MDSPFGMALKKYRENTDLFRGLREGGKCKCKGLDILEIAYLDSIGWNFDEGAPDRELLSGPYRKDLSGVP